MTKNTEAISTMKGWLEHSPPKPKVEPPEGLTGWKGDGIEICADCAGRMSSRGVAWDSYAKTPVWDNPVKCDTCQVWKVGVILCGEPCFAGKSEDKPFLFSSETDAKDWISKQPRPEIYTEIVKG